MSSDPRVYDERFFDEQLSRSAQSAERIVPYVVNLVHPRSVCDVGCGTGAWALEFARTGVNDYIGVDGYVEQAQLLIPPDRFQRMDLNGVIELERRFDLAVCLEVAEHLRPERAAGLVGDLVRLADVVLFSAAVPGQGGAAHVNERWQDYWAGLFAEHRYRAVDAIRPTFWEDPHVDWWYLQNSFLFVREGNDLLTRDWPALPVRLIHPRAYQQARTLGKRTALRRLLGLPLRW